MLAFGSLLCNCHPDPTVVILSPTPVILSDVILSLSKDEGRR
jgi:hypothetical protein